MITSSSQGGHSAHMKMLLLVNGSSIAVAQMGPDFLLVDSPINHPPGDARLVLEVGQSEPGWNVHLPDGISSAPNRITVSARI